MTDTEPDVPDLRSLITEHATPAAAEVTIPLNQGLAAEIARLESELEQIAASAPPSRMGAKSPLKVKAQEIEDARARMAGSLVTFRFGPLSAQAREEIRQAMFGRDDPDEQGLRINAAMCIEPKGATWEDFRDLRDTLGVGVYAEIDEAANRAAGVLSVPFSSAASLILGTAK